MDQAVATPTQAGHNRPRNPGVPLAPDWFESVGVNASAVERRAATLTTRRSVKKEYQAAWLVKAMTCIDLTTLSGDDTPGRVRRLCAKARHPLERRAARRARSRRPGPDGRRGLRLSDHGRACGQGARGLGDSGRLRRDRLSGRAHPPEAAPGGDPLCGRGGRARDRHRHHPRPCAQPRLERALRRGRGDARSLRASASEDDPRHGRPEDAAQRLCGQHGGDAGGRRLHQDLHRQGGRQRHACRSVS